MAKKGKKPAKTCADCIHEFACSMWNIGYIHNMDATNCTNHETIKDCSSYFIGFSDGQKSKPLNGWISVLDRLPETDGIYIVCDCQLNGNPWIHTAGFIKASSSWCEEHGVYYDDRYGRYSEQDKITHWMKMPEPPET